jgi:hypothetical protein
VQHATGKPRVGMRQVFNFICVFLSTMILWLVVGLDLIFAAEWVNNWWLNPKPVEYYQARGFFPEP